MRASYLQVICKLSTKLTLKTRALVKTGGEWCQTLLLLAQLLLAQVVQIPVDLNGYCWPRAIGWSVLLQVLDDTGKPEECCESKSERMT